MSTAAAAVVSVSHVVLLKLTDAHSNGGGGGGGAEHFAGRTSAVRVPHSLFDVSAIARAASAGHTKPTSLHTSCNTHTHSKEAARRPHLLTSAGGCLHRTATCRSRAPSTGDSVAPASAWVLRWSCS